MRRDPSQVLAVGVSGPLEPYVAGFASHLAGRGYAPLSAANQLRVLAHLSRWLGERGLPVEGFTPERVDAFSCRSAGGGLHVLAQPARAGAAAGLSA